MTNKDASSSILRVLAVLLFFTCAAKTAPSYGAVLCSQVLYQNGTENRSLLFQRDFERLELRYGGQLVLEETESTSSLQYLTLRDADTRKTKIGELSFRYFKDEQKLVILLVEADRRRIGIARSLYAAALEKYPETKSISTNVLLDTNETIVRARLAQGLSLEQAIKETAAYKLRASFGFDQIVPESINDHFGFVVQKKQDNHGRFIEIQNPVGPVGLKELSRQLGWQAQEGKIWKEMQQATDSAHSSALTRYDRRQYPWQKMRSTDQLIQTVTENAKQTPAADELITLGSHRLRYPSVRVVDGVWLVELGKEGRWYFHASTGEGAKNPRAIWIVELIREALDFKGVPESRLGSLNNVKGIFTREVSGKTLASYQGHVNIESVYQAMGFDFLVQHRDTHFNNFIVTDKGEVQGLDYPSVFEIRPVPERNLESPFGELLPPTYDSQFLGRLMGLTPEFARARWNGKMTSQEIESFLLLREIILLDAKNKGLTPTSIAPAEAPVPALIQAMGF